MVIAYFCELNFHDWPPTVYTQTPEKRGHPGASTNQFDMFGNLSVQVPPNRTPEGSYLVRLVVPRPAAGVLIGKGGAVIKQISEATSCKLQLGDEKDPYGTNERLFNVSSSTVQHLVEVLFTLFLIFLASTLNTAQ